MKNNRKKPKQKRQHRSNKRTKKEHEKKGEQGKVRKEERKRRTNDAFKTKTSPIKPKIPPFSNPANQLLNTKQ